jgi:hypothetical protein
MSFQKKILSFLVFLVMPWQLPAQDITGLWTGYLESAGSRIPYEVVISTDGGKWNGYALSVFSFNETENIGIKTIELRQKKGALSLEDHDLVFDNYKTPPRRIKMIASLMARGRDTGMVLEGSFFTRSLDFRSQDKAAFTGIIHLKKRKNDEVTRLTSKLEEMNLLASLSFAASLPPKGSIGSTATRETNQTTKPDHKEVIPSPTTPPATPAAIIEKESITIAKTPQMATPVVPVSIEEESLPEQKERSTIEKSQPASPAKDKWQPSNNNPAERKLVKISPPVREEDKAVAIINKPTPAHNQKIEKPHVVPATVSNAEDSVAIERPSQKVLVKEIPATIRKPQIAILPQPAAALANRKTEVIQNIYFTSDSLVLSIYDNGTIDGDTVSVVLNGRVILARKGLTANAIRTTIPVTPDMGDSLQLVMYAENLGSIPPNTGLLIVQDGDQRYDIRFAGDMKKSSAVILRRKR